MNVNQNQIEVGDYAKTYGFEIEETGGGCTALEHLICEGVYIMIIDDAEVPENLNDLATLAIYVESYNCIFEAHMTTKSALNFGYWVSYGVQRYIADADFSTNEIESLLNEHNLNSENAWRAIQSCVDAITQKDEPNAQPLVTKAGTITTDEPLFMCWWDGDNYQIHTRATLWENFKDTNLFDADEDGWCVGVNFPMLLERLHLELDFTTYHNDNMSIKRIK